MTDVRTPAWRPTGLVWSRTGVALEWLSPVGEVRASSLDLGSRLSLQVGPDRLCVGLWWDGRHVPCAAYARIAAEAKSGQCGSCAAIARSRSVATDTRLDDPREFAVYLAHHGSVVKVGITATERGPARLLEQGALSSLFLSAGTLLSARRSEALLTTALGLPQQVRTARKRAARLAPGTASARAAALTDIATQAAGLDWPPGQRRTSAEPVDHTPVYGLPDGGITPVLELDPLRAGAAISGDVVCRIGRDLYLTSPHGLTLFDTGLLQGWALSRADDGTPLTAQTTAVAPPRTPAPETGCDVLF
ncbi:DUF2797 domain-containing protein [Promicromonospora iranensis]|uniref:DUF2797 domain-containing protein n=1 Tax=Promicromonospora iranensis TaxID=1105144 RepID=UPI0023A95DAC|nr:DUF2797 domain-containing protein [Promicromonospora iranensis]